MIMRLAIPVWQGEVSTTADFARDVLVADVEGTREITRQNIGLSEQIPVQRAWRLRDLGVQVFICGAISRPLAWSLSQAGIRVVPCVAGSADEVVAAFLCGQLNDPRFLQAGSLPGVQRRWRHGRRFGGGRW